MSLTINTSGGGGGSIQSTDALVRVVTDYGSSVSVTAGGTTKNLKPLVIIGDTDHSCYYDLVKPGAFSSTARSYSVTLGGNTVSDTLVVNAAGEYTKPISFWNGQLYLNGNDYAEITGGYEGIAIRYAASYGGEALNSRAPTVTPGDTSMAITLTSTGSNNYSGSVLTRNKIDLTPYSTITFNANIVFQSADFASFYVSDTNTSYSSAAETFITRGNIPSSGVVTLDVSQLSGEYYVGVNMSAGAVNPVTTTITITSIIAS